MRPRFPAGPATRFAIYWLGFLAAVKALSLVLIAQAIATMLAGLASGDSAWADQLTLGLVGVVLRSVTVWAQAVAARRAALGIKEELRASLLAHALRNGARATGPADGGLAVLASRGLDALDNYYTQFLPALVNCATIPLLIGARILFADWVSALVVVLTVPLVPLFMVLIGRYTEDEVRDAQASLTRLSTHMLELAKGLPVLVGLGRATAQRKALEEISEEYRTKTMGTLRTAFLSSLALELIATISVAVVAVFIGVRLVHGEMPLEAGLLALILAPDCYLPMRELGTAHHASDDGRVALTQTNDVLAAPVATPLAVTGDALGRPGVAAGVPANDVGARVSDAMRAGLPATGVSATPLTVADLAVTYSGRGIPAVGPLSFTAPSGLITALDGPSGAGKSTVLGVLAGTVGYDAGTTVRGSLTGLDRQAIAWVPQHPVLVADTVLDEVLLYLSAASGPDPVDLHVLALRCLDRAAAGHLAGKHPAELSPGELRRVALARGFARLETGATLLLLDEPTAHLDQVSARVVEDAVAALRGRVTVILVAHEERTRALADHIVAVGSEATLVAAAPAHTAGASVQGAAAPTVPVHPVPPGSNAENPRQSAGTGHGSAAHTDPSPEPTAAGRLLARLLAAVRGKFIAAAVVGTLASLFAVALSGLAGWLIIRASEQPPILYLLGAIVGVRFFGIGRAVLRYWERLLLHDAVFAALTSLRGRLWASLSRRAMSLRRLLQGGNVLGTIVDDVDTIRDLLPRVVLPPVTAVAVFALALVATGLTGPAAIPAVVIAGIASLVVAPVVALWGDRTSASTEQRLRAGVLRRISAALDARAELHVNGVAAQVLAGLRADDHDATRASQRSAWADGLGQAITTASCCVAALATGWLVAPAVLAGALDPAIAAVLVLLVLALVEPFAAMTTAVRQYPALRAVLRRVGESGALDGATTDEQSAAETGLVPVPARRGGLPGIQLTGVSAAWPGGPDVFAAVDAVAEPGRWLAITGPSGAGKSTLLSVLLGFLPVSAGSVAATGRVAWCPQEAHLFDSTIRGNLLLGWQTPRAGEAPGDSDLMAAIGSVGLSELLARLPEGLATRIGPGGAFLSGGERQRLAVARTLLTGAEVILLDEPTAHLDADSAAAMLADLRQGLSHRTVVLVTHNPADILPTDARLELSAPNRGGLADYAVDPLQALHSSA